MLWFLSKSKEDEGYWFGWLKKRLQAGVPFNTPVQHNLMGAWLEKEGRLDEAINLYEQNLIDQFDDTHSYERLHSIYFQRGEYTKVIRVNQAFLVRSNQIKVEKFPKRINKLKAKM